MRYPSGVSVESIEQPWFQIEPISPPTKDTLLASPVGLMLAYLVNPYTYYYS